jgi:hypothetical protein
MTGHAILGETVLKQAKVIAAEAPAETLETLVAQHTLMVFRIAYSILRNHHDAEDAAQECFLRVLKYGPRLHQVRHRLQADFARSRRASPAARHRPACG